MSGSIGEAGAGRAAKGFVMSLGLMAACAVAQATPKFKVLAFGPMSGDQGHDSYIHEANKWFPKMAAQYGFQYDSTKNWADCNAAKLGQYKVVIFFDNRPDNAQQREAFKAYMDNGGGWIGSHFAAFALNGSAVQQNWNWYHNDFLGSGEYQSNTWKPTSAFLKVEDQKSPFTQGLGTLFKASPNEWYRWKNDLKTKPDIRILCSIDPSSFPLGTGPKPHEIWHEGYYPVVWTNVKYKMLYLNMGHNDIDYANGNKDLSQTFDNETQNKLILNALMEFGGIATPVLRMPEAGAARAAFARPAGAIIFGLPEAGPRDARGRALPAARIPAR